jgi:hypothetical protein
MSGATGWTTADGIRPFLEMILIVFPEKSYIVSRCLRYEFRVNLIRRVYKIVVSHGSFDVEKLWKTRGQYANLRLP